MTKTYDALIIGSDQVPELDGALLRKPGTAERAVEQLLASRGRTVRFQTAVCLLDAQASGLPVVATTHCDIPEITVPGGSALLVPERDARRSRRSVSA